MLKYTKKMIEASLFVEFYHSKRFTVKSNSKAFLRFAISSPATGEELEKGLLTVRAFLEKNA